MRTRVALLFLFLLLTSPLRAELTIEQCVEKAAANYPAIRKYNLISADTDIDLSDINRSWLPQVGLYAQVTGQNIVPSFPEALSGVLQTMGQDVRGLGKIQYKLGAEITQTIWDGGATKEKRELTRSHEALREASLEVELYQVRQRVENLYFAILLTEEQIEQSRVTYDVLCDNLEKLRSMHLNGTAMQSDVDMMEAQALGMNQNIVRAQSASRSYRRALELFTGESLGEEKLIMPGAEMPLDLSPARPELRLFERKMDYNEAGRRLADTSRMPRLGFFAQGYYGYPGINYFKSMMDRSLSFNIVAGLKVAWNIDAFYTSGNRAKRTAIQAAEIAVDRDVFLFNTHNQTDSQVELIKGMRDMMKDDLRIVELRSRVRQAAESQLANGVIDITALLTKISDENIALLATKYHEIQLLQEIYKLKYTLDR